MAACYLFAVYASVRALDGRVPDAGNCRRGRLRRRHGSKETMVTAPLAIALYDRVFAYPTWASALRARGRLYIGLATSWLILAPTVLINGQTYECGFRHRADVAVALLRQPDAGGCSLPSADILSASLVLYYGWPLPLTLADVWPAALVVFSLTGVVVWTLVRYPRVGYLGAWVILTLAPASSVVPVGTEVAAERRMYLPIAGLIALIVLAIVWLVARVGASRPTQPSRSPSWVAVGVTVTMAIALGAATIARTHDYASSIRMAELDVERWPTPQSHQVFGAELAAAGRHSEAIDHLRRAAEAYPGARYFLGAELLTTGQLDAAIVELQRFVQAEPNLPVVPGARVMMARALEARARVPEAIEQLKLALTASPSRADAHGQLANLLAGTQQFAEAIPHYRAFLDASPRNAEAWTGLAIAQISSGKPGEAVASFKSAVDANPQNPQFRFNYARALLEQGNGAGARAQLERALQIDPTFGPASEMLKRLPK
jgi:tetratricopeptide (TPR) repeat protein